MIREIDKYIETGQFMSQYTWKSTIRRRLAFVENENMRHLLANDQDLNTFDQVHVGITPHVFSEI